MTLINSLLSRFITLLPLPLSEYVISENRKLSFSIWIVFWLKSFCFWSLINNGFLECVHVLGKSCFWPLSVIMHWKILFKIFLGKFIDNKLYAVPKHVRRFFHVPIFYFCWSSAYRNSSYNTLLFIAISFLNYCAIW